MLGRRVLLPKCISPSSRRNPSAPSKTDADNGNGSSHELMPSPVAISSVPIPSSPTKDPASSANNNSTAIKVVVRVRPLSERELLAKSPVVVNVTKSSVQVLNPALFSDPTFLDAVSTATAKYSAHNPPVALTAQAITAASQAGECRSFFFDRCFGVDNAAANLSEPFANAYDIDVTTQRPNQELVFEEIGREIIPSTFQGFNCTVFAYGQTGSGKTHTMVGEKSTTRGKGVIPRVCEALFQGIDARRAKENELAVEVEAAASAAMESGSSVPTNGIKKTVFAVQMSYCEIYKEKVHDLLEGAPPTLTPTSSFSLSSSAAMNETLAAAPVSPVGSAANRGRILKVREHPITGPFVEGLSTRLVGSYEDIAEEILAGDKLRTVAATLMNPVSSRSHAMFTLTLTQTTFDAVTNVPSVKTSKIAMIDLAGSERANVSGTSGDRLKEGAMINKSLTTLGRVISALSKNLTSSERVPYRDSTLTWLLKESLGGNAKTTMIAMVSPAAENYEETMSTLRYAESAKKVMNRAVVNEDPNARVIRQLRDEIQQLRDQLNQRETEAFYLVENLKDKPELPPSMQDREDFYREMQDEMGTYRSRIEGLMLKQAEDEAQRKNASRVVRMHAEFPSLLNIKPPASVTTSDVVICTLREGVCVVGSGGEITNEDTPISAAATEPTDKADDRRSPRRTARNASWAGSFLKRRKSSAGESPTSDVPVVTVEDGRPASPRKRSLSRQSSQDGASDAPTEEPTTFLRLSATDDADDDVLPKHAMLMIRSRVVAPPDETPEAPDEVEYVVELQPLATDAVVLVNGNHVVSDARTRVLHGDVISFGQHHRFCLHVPHIASKLKALSASRPAQEKPFPLDDLVSEANAICEKWHFQMEFAVATTPLVDPESGGSMPPAPRVLAKKRLGDKRCSISEWSRETFHEQLVLLRQFTASLDPPLEASHDFATVVEDEEDEAQGRASRKASSSRNADHMIESEASLNDDSRSTQTRMVPASMSLDGGYSTMLDTTAQPHVTASVAPLSLPPQSMSVRLLGHLRIYLSALDLDKDPYTPRDVSLSLAAYDVGGHQVARLHCRLHSLLGAPTAGAAGERGEAEVSGGNILKRRFSFRSPRSSQVAANKGLNYQSNRVSAARLYVTIDRVQFLSTAGAPKQLSLALKKWGSLHAGCDDESSVTSAVESTLKTMPTDTTAAADEPPTFVFNHTMQITVPIAVNSPACDEFLSAELWGYGESAPPRLSILTVPPSKPHKVELFVSIDIEERDADGFFRPVAVKSDGTLRLHINQPRRVSLRITQADHGPLVLRDFAIARLSPAFTARGASNLVIGEGKSMQSLLLPPASSGVGTGSARSAATTEVDELPTFKEWLRLFPRSAAELDVSSRSLTVSLRWERNAADSPPVSESEDGADARTVYRLAIALQTTLSHVPIVVCKSVVTKLSTSEVSSSQRLAREWEISRTAWWARESYSRSFRLGTWYSVDVAQHAHRQEDTETPVENTSDGPSEEGAMLEPPAFGEAITTRINALRRLEICFALERVRQEIVIKYFSSRISDEYPLTLERAQEGFEQLLALSDQEEEANVSPPVIKVLLLDDGAIYLRHKASKEIFIAIESGDIAAPPDTSKPRTDLDRGPEVSGHVMHFVSEPTSLAGDTTTSGGGELCGFLMFSTSIQLDESAVGASVSSPTTNAVASPSSSNPLSWARNSLTNRLSWERRWFVLKLPFLYAYRSFARKEQIGVLDVVRCQLVVPSASSTGTSLSAPRRQSLPGLVSRRGSKEDPPSGGGSSGAFPFCFQLVSLAGGKCVVWSLQASTQIELRAWLGAIDPLKIEARQAIVTSNGEPEDTAVLATT